MKRLFKLLILFDAISLAFALAGCGDDGMFKVPSYQVSFYNGDELIYQADVRSAAMVKVSKFRDTITLFEGYELAGFFDEAGKEFTKEYELTGDASFYARISPIEYTITYELGEGVSCDNPTKYTVETNTFTLSEPYGQSEDLDFAGWTTNESSAPEKNVSVVKGTTGDLYFKANFEDNTSYYLYFETYGGTEIERLTNKTGVFELPDQKPEKSGYNFVKWYSDENLMIPVVGSTYVSVVKRATVYAKYELLTYTVSFIGCDLDTISYTVETDTFTVPQPEKTGNTFIGYTYDTVTTPVKNFTVGKGTHRDYVLTANFEVNSYTITFNTFGGSEVDPMTAPYGSALTAPEDPEKAGCTFLGWYTDEICNNKYTFSTMPAENITLYAGWYSDENYTLKYSVTDGVGAEITANRASGGKVLAEETVTLSAPAYAYGGVFRYWKKQGSGLSSSIYSYDNELTFTMPHANLTLVAEYKSASSFTYAAGGGDLNVTSATIEKVFGNKISDADWAGGAIKSSYLDKLNSGDYLFELMTSGGNAPVIIRVAAENSLSRVKLDYDVNYPEVTLVFDGQSGAEYEYSLNSSAYADCQSGMILSGFNKQRGGGNKITVRRKDDHTDAITFTKSAYNTVNSSYYTTTFNYNGRTYDLVIEDYDELQAMMGYFATVYVPDSNNRSSYMGYAGGKATYKFYIEAAFRDEFEANEDEYVNFIITRGSMPYYPSYDNDFVRATGIETVSYYLNSAELNTEKSTQTVVYPSATQKLLNYTSTRAIDYDGFKINGYSATQSIRSLYELESLAYGVKPTFASTTGQAYDTYEKAKMILRQIVCDDMNDYQKVVAIYDYLALTVTYDHAVAGMSGSSSSGIGKYRCFTSYGALVDGVAVCDGISSAFRLLCAIEGIEAEEYTGISVASGSLGGHAWNKVKVGGNWYGVDATWWNIKVDGTTYVRHSNLLVSESSLYESGHRERAETDDGGVIEYPVETACYGLFDYYSIEIYGTDGLTRNVKAQTEMNKLIMYARSMGATTVEFKNSSPHSVNTLLVASGTSGSYAVLDADKGLYLAYL